MHGETRKGPILVLGGTGHYGRHIVRSLVEKRQPVRVLSRNGSGARRVLGDGPEILEGDITSRQSVVKALRGARAVLVSLSAFSPKLIRQMERIERDAVLTVLKEAQVAGISPTATTSSRSGRTVLSARTAQKTLSLPAIQWWAAPASIRTGRQSKRFGASYPKPMSSATRRTISRSTTLFTTHMRRSCSCRKGQLSG